MNKQIKLLTKQAGGIQYDEDGDELIPILVGKDLEKFAELIVWECVRLQHRNIVVGSASEYNRGKRELAEDILRHFGVKE